MAVSPRIANIADISMALAVYFLHYGFYFIFYELKVQSWAVIF
jgi:hypothetical protein